MCMDLEKFQESGVRELICSLGIMILKNFLMSMIMSLYVDDILVSRNDEKEINEFKVVMKKKFEMSDLGLLSHFLRI